MFRVFTCHILEGIIILILLKYKSQIFVIKGEQVYLVEGEVYNTKITYPYDLRVAESLLSDQKNAN